MEKELRYLNKTEKGVLDAFVKELKEKLGDEIVSIRLFGSKVRGDFYQDSGRGTDRKEGLLKEKC